MPAQRKSKIQITLSQKLKEANSNIPGLKHAEITPDFAADQTAPFVAWTWTTTP